MAPQPLNDLIAEMSFATASSPSASHPASASTSTSTLSSLGTTENKKEAVVMVTPYSTGCCIAQEVQRRGYALLCLWNRDFSDDMKKHVPTTCTDLTYFAEITESSTLDETIRTLHQTATSGGYTITSVICGGEAGVDLADALSERMNMVTNGTDIPNRRDKKVQQELIAARGLRSIRQAGGSKFHEVEEFLQSETYPVVVKPVDSAGSDGVKLCHSFEEAKEHFHYLLEYTPVNGGTCDMVLCQEYLRGKEYVVDHVSRDGVHKTVMCWVYDKRPANGAQFVYHGVVPVDSESPEAKAMIPYVRGVLDCLGVRHGPSHGEVIFTETGPCLVEMNCRAHGGDGNWQSLCEALCGGVTQVTATVDSYLDVEAFRALPDRPPSPFLASGQEVDLVSFFPGVVTGTPGFEKIRNLRSFVLLESHVGPGVKISKTIDLVTDIGNVILMHHDSKVLEEDISFIRSIEQIPGALFELEADSDEEEEKPEQREEEEMEDDGVFPILTRTLSTPKSHRYGHFDFEPQTVQKRKHFRNASDISDLKFPAMVKTMSEWQHQPRRMPTVSSQEALVPLK